MKKLTSAILAMAILSTSTAAFATDNTAANRKVASKKIAITQIKETVKFNVLPDLKSLKPEVRTKMEALTKNRGFFYMSNTGSSGFIFRIAAGEKPNAGYGIKIKSVKYSSGKMKIVVEETLPKAGVMYTEQLTYPTVTFKAPLVSEVVDVQNTKGQKFKFIMPKSDTSATKTDTGTLYINKVSSLSSPKLLVPEGTYSKELTMNELSEYFGRDPMPIVPDGFKPDNDKSNIMFKSDGNIFYMSEFTYSKDINDPNSPSISLQLNKGALPLRDCFYSSNPKESMIGNTKLVIGLMKMTDSSTDQNSTTDYDVYTSQFIYNGIGYDITAKRVDEQSFLTLLKSIIK